MPIHLQPNYLEQFSCHTLRMGRWKAPSSCRPNVYQVSNSKGRRRLVLKTNIILRHKAACLNSCLSQLIVSKFHFRTKSEHKNICFPFQCNWFSTFTFHYIIFTSFTLINTQEKLSLFYITNSATVMWRICSFDIDCSWMLMTSHIRRHRVV